MNSRFLRVVLLFSVSIITATGLWAQLRLKLQLLPDGQTYGVFVRPDDGLVISDNSITASAQVTVVMPVAFTWDNLTNHNGSWISNAQVVAPSENPGAKYVSFGFQGDDPPVAYAPGEEILLFTFRNTGSCPEFLYLIDCGTPDESDPFCPPNSLQTNPGNDLVVFDFQNGNTSFYYYAGNYGEYAWDCHDADGDGIVNAHEDTNGNGVFDPAEDASDLFDPNDPSGDGGLQLSLQLLPGGNSWGVFARPVGGVVPSPNTTTLEGHTEIVAPAGFEIDSVVSHAGTWVHDTSLNAPQENPGRSYLGFTLLADDPPIQYHENEPTLLFTIYYSGNCPDSIHIMDETTDPLALACVPTQNNLCIFNKLNVIDEGAVPMAEYYYVGNYGLAAWNCHDSDGDGIPNAFEDTNGDGNFDPDEGETDPNDPCDPYSPEGAFLVYDGPVVTCAGQPVENATLTVEVETGTDLNTTYTVVYTDGIDVMTLTGYESGQPIPVLGFGGASYKLIAVTNANGCGVAPAALEGGAFIETEGPVNIIAHPAPVTTCAYSGVVLEAEVTNGGVGTLSLQWQMSCDGGNTWSDVADGGSNGITGSTSSSLTVSNLQPSVSGCLFRLSARTQNCPIVFSNPAAVVVEGPVSIEQSPANVETCAGQSACFSVVASQVGAGQLLYQWQARQPGSSAWADLTDNGFVAGASTAQLCLNAAATANGQAFRALVRTQSCPEQVSEAALLTLDGPLTVLSAPTDLEVESFENATFEAVIANEGNGTIYFQWQQSTDGQNWADLQDGIAGNNFISGANTPLLTIAPAAGMDGRQFRLIAHTYLCSNIVSPSAKLTVNGTRLTIVEDLDNIVEQACAGEMVILVVNYENTEGIPAGMTWQLSTDGINWTPVPDAAPYQMANQPDFITPGFFNAILAINTGPELDGLRFRCRLVSSVGQEVISMATQLQVSQPLTFLRQPDDANVCFNEDHTFTVTIGNAAGADVEMFWTMSTDGGESWQILEENGSGGIFQNVHTPALYLSEVEGLDGALFQLVVMNGPCAGLSQPALLSVVHSPQCYPPTGFVDFKLQLRPDGESWGVWIKAADGFDPTGYNFATSGHIVIAATSGFAYYDVQSHAGGTWKPGKYLLNVPETPGLSWYAFDLEPGTNELYLEPGNEIMLFSFRRQGDCPDEIFLAHTLVPEGMEPASFTGIDLGTSPHTVFALNEVYGPGAADCKGGGQNLATNPGNNPGSSALFESPTPGKMLLSPNPATDRLHISLPSDTSREGSLTHSIYSTSGAVVKNFAANPHGQIIPLDGLPAGLYFITYEVNGKIINRQKFVVK